MKNTIKHVDRIIQCLKKDPNASKDAKNYVKTKEYLLELVDKDESVLEGLIRALECYLEK